MHSARAILLNSPTCSQFTDEESTGLAAGVKTVAIEVDKIGGRTFYESNFTYWFIHHPFSVESAQLVQLYGALYVELPSQIANDRNQ